MTFDRANGLVRFEQPPLPAVIAFGEEDLQRWAGVYQSTSGRFAIVRDSDQFLSRPCVSRTEFGRMRALIDRGFE